MTENIGFRYVKQADDWEASDGKHVNGSESIDIGVARAMKRFCVQVNDYLADQGVRFRVGPGYGVNIAVLGFGGIQREYDFIDPSSIGIYEHSNIEGTGITLDEAEDRLNDLILSIEDER